MTTSQHKSQALMLLIALLQGMVFYAPVATLYRTSRGLSILDIALIESISLALWLLLEIPWGFIADRIGYKNTLLFCNALYFLSKIIFWKATGFSGFLLERLLLAIVCAGLSGCDSAYLFVCAENAQRAKLFGRYAAAQMAGLSIAAMICATLAGDDLSLCALLTVGSYGVSLLATCFLADLRGEVRQASFCESLSSIFNALHKNRRFLLFLLASALLSECNQTITVFLNQLQYLRAGITPGSISVLYIGMSLLGLCAAGSDRLSRRLGRQRSAAVLFCSGAAACLLLAMTANPVLSVAGVFLLRLSASLFAPLSTTVQNESVTIADRASLLSVYSAVMNLVAIATSLAFGALAQAALPAAFLLGSALCGAGLVCCLLSGATKQTATSVR